jgi:tetratricopeptide (TPR) repeat protein
VGAGASGVGAGVGGDAAAGGGGGGGAATGVGAAPAGAAPPASGYPSRFAHWSAWLERAKSDLARRAFPEAQRNAEALLAEPVPREIRAAALLVAADAAYGARAYGQAARRYAEFVNAEPSAPESARAAMAVGWSRLRQGDRERARAAFVSFADARPTDGRTPVALMLAAELANQAGDTATSQRLVDRLVTQHPRSVYASTARLARASLALRRAQEPEALREIDEVIAKAGPAALDERRTLAEVIAAPGTEASLEAVAPPRALAAETGQPLDRFAARLLESGHRETSPYVLHGVALVAGRDRGWSDPLTTSLVIRLAESFPSYAPASQLVSRVASSAATAGQWPVALRAWQTLITRVPAASVPRSARLGLAEAYLRTGATATARAQLEGLASGGGAEAVRALLLLTELHTAAGDRKATLAAYERLQREHPRAERPAASLLAHAQLLEDAGQASRARPLLQRAVELGQGEVAAEAAYRLGQAWRADGHHVTAVEWYLTAAYAPGGGQWSRLGLLGAGRSLTALNEKKEALAVYSKLIPTRPGVDRPEDREVSGEAAYRAGEIFRDLGLHTEALNLFTTAADLTVGSPAERRALLAALQCQVKLGNRSAAEATYRRLTASGMTEPELLEQAREALRLTSNGRSAPGGGGPGESALPKTTR